MKKYQVTYTNAKNSHYTILVDANNEQNAISIAETDINYNNLLFVKEIKKASDYGV